MIEAWMMDILCEKAFSDTGIHWRVLEDTFFAGIEDLKFSAWPAPNQQIAYIWWCKGDLTEYRNFHFADLLRVVFE
jgi:hypothetical protein